MAKTITHLNNDETATAFFGEREHLSVAESETFTKVTFEALVERVPTSAEVSLTDLILNLCFDHGENSPSAQSTINASKEGKTLGEAVGEGITQIGDKHGGAAKPLMIALYAIEEGNMSAQEYVQGMVTEGKRIPGLGHRVYKDQDPRAQFILQKVKETNPETKFIEILESIKSELSKQSGKDLPINIDGAIAVAFCSMGLAPEVGIAIFIVARSLGLCGHAINNSANAVKIN